MVHDLRLVSLGQLDTAFALLWGSRAVRCPINRYVPRESATKMQGVTVGWGTDGALPLHSGREGEESSVTRNLRLLSGGRNKKSGRSRNTSAPGRLLDPARKDGIRR